MNGPEVFLTLFGLGLVFILIGIQSTVLLSLVAIGIVLLAGSFILFLPIIPVRTNDKFL